MQCNALPCSLLEFIRTFATERFRNVWGLKTSLGKNGRFRTSGSTFSLRSTRLQFDHFLIRWYTKLCIRVRTRTRIFIFVKKRRDFPKNKWKFGHVYGRESKFASITDFHSLWNKKKINTGNVVVGFPHGRFSTMSQSGGEGEQEEFLLKSSLPQNGRPCPGPIDLSVGRTHDTSRTTRHARHDHGTGAGVSWHSRFGVASASSCITPPTSDQRCTSANALDISTMHLSTHIVDSWNCWY